MTPTRSEAHTVILPSGLRVDRLPLGFAVGRWWLTFVLSARDRWFERWVAAHGGFLHESLSGVIQLSGPHGSFTALTSAGAGSSDDDIVHALYEIRPVAWVKISYADNSESCAEERLELTHPDIR
ncbi:hypothetical protein FXB39_09255 [Nocardioides sp. BGMRC 2183]|nr:hypothetical protein FXB39_09255 [Nocardioides sp. BGMRC 2183]